MDIKEYWNKGKNLWVTSKDMKNDSIHDSLMKITDEALNIMTQYEKDTLLVVTRSGILRHSLPIAILEKNATINQDIKSIMPLNGIIPKFLFYAIKANENIILTEYHKDGTTVDSIDFDKFKCLPIPLPPINEQKRIITEVLKVSASIDCIDCGKADLYTAIAQAKSKILDLAIHGKLVPQDPTDEPASELLKRINPKAEITSDNGHYQKLPEGWCLCDLSSLCKIKGGKRIPRGRTFSKERTPHIYIRVSDMKNNTIITTDLKYIDDDVYQTIKNYTISSSDLYLTIAGTIGHVGIVPKQFDGMNLTENAAKLTGIICDKKYLLYSLLSSTAQEHFKSRFHQVAQPKLSIETASSTMIYLPPLKEQHRIVSQIEEIFAQLDTIEASL